MEYPPGETSQFIREIGDRANERCRFTALLGAGLSIASGIPATKHLPQHLAFCLNAWLAGTWDPQSGNWPSFGESQQVSISTHRNNWLASSQELVPPEQIEKDPGDSQKKQALFHKAIAAVYDWKEALHLLTRARLTKRETDLPPQADIDVPDLTVIDSYFQFLVRHKEPALGHKMIIALSGLLRINTVLTTNYDDLLEKEFRNTGMHVDTYEVHRDAGLPSPRLILGSRTIIKLHGGRYGLRADWSLSQPPSEHDKRVFASYLTGEDLTSDGRWAKFAAHALGTGNNSAPPQDTVCLLVAGYSADDKRIRGLILEAGFKLPTLNIFWVCHNEIDRQNLSNYIKDIMADAPKSSTLHVTAVIADFGLLMLQLYQRLTQTLPPTGAFFPTSWAIPFPCFFPTPSGELAPKYNGAKEQLENKIREAISNPEICCVHVKSGQDHYGSLTLASHLALITRWTPQTNAKPPPIQVESIWLDLDDVLDPDDLFFHLVAILYKRSGINDPRPHFPSPPRSAKDIATWFIEQTNTLGPGTASHIIVYLNGRDKPGGNHFVRMDFKTDQDPWKNSQSFYNKWLTTVNQINSNRKSDGAESTNLTLLLLTHADDNTINWAAGDHSRYEQSIEIESLVEFDKQKVIEDALTWVEDKHKIIDSNKFLLLYGLVEFDFVRSPAAMAKIVPSIAHSNYVDPEEISTSSRSSEGTSEDQPKTKPAKSDTQVSVNPPKGKTLLEGWIEELESLKLIRFKPGGFIWMNLSVRDGLRIRLNALMTTNHSHRRLKTLSLVAHKRIARWYGRLFISSSDPRAALATASHALNGVALGITDNKSLVKLGPICVTLLRHAKLVVMSAEKLLKRSVAEEQTATSFDFLRQRCEKILKTLNDLAKTKQPNSQLIPANPVASIILADLHNLYETITRVAIAVWHVEGNKIGIASAKDNYERTSMQNISDRRPGLSRWASIPQEAELHRSYVLLAQRNYGEACDVLHTLIANVLKDDISSSSGPTGTERNQNAMEISPEKPDHALITNVLKDEISPSSGPTGTEQNQNPMMISPEKLDLQSILQSIFPKDSGLRHLRLSSPPPTEVASRAAAWMLDKLSNASDSRIAFGVRLFRRVGYVAMHVGQAHFLAPAPSPPKDIDFGIRLRYLNCAAEWFELALELLRCTTDEDDEFVYHQNARIRAHLSVVVARLAGLRLEKARRATSDASPGSGAGDVELLPEAETLYQSAERALLDAEAFVVEFPLQHDTLSRAIILLRRAELRLRKARNIETFAAAFNQVSETNSVSPLVNEASKNDNVRAALTCARLIQDAWTCLEEADIHLVPHIKDEWWPQLAFILKVEAAETWHICMHIFSKAANKSHSSAEIPGSWIILDGKIVAFLERDLSRMRHFVSRRDPFVTARIVDNLLKIDRTISQRSPRPNWISHCLRIFGDELRDFISPPPPKQPDTSVYVDITRYALRIHEQYKSTMASTQ